jgi:primosomal protein N''
MADFYNQMDDLKRERQAAEQEADRLTKQFTAIAEQLAKWRIKRVDPDLQPPTPRQVSDAKNKWLDAQRRAGEVLRDAHDADPKTAENLKKLHPEVEMDTSVRYKGRGQS